MSEHFYVAFLRPFLSLPVLLCAFCPCSADDKEPDYFCSYIESKSQYQTPAPWIDTGVQATPLTSLSMDIEFTNIKNASQLPLFGLHYNTNPKFCFIAYIGDGEEKKIDYKYVDGGWNSSNVSTISNIFSRLRVTLDGSAKSFSITSNTFDGAVVELCRKSLTQNHAWPNDFHSPHTIPLFNKWNSNANSTNLHNRSLAARLYKCTISTNGVCVRSFRPAVKNSVPGLWDTVEKVFYSSESDAPFLAGPKLKDGLIIYLR